MLLFMLKAATIMFNVKGKAYNWHILRLLTSLKRISLHQLIKVELARTLSVK